MYRNISGLGLVVGAVMNRHGVVGSLEVTVRVIQSCSVSIYIYTVMNTTILQLVAIYNIQLHVSALYLGHHQVVRRTY